jgi:hypothetical protein
MATTTRRAVGVTLNLLLLANRQSTFFAGEISANYPYLQAAFWQAQIVDCLIIIFFT